MIKITLVAALVIVGTSSLTANAQEAPTDPQIAHIAYLAGQIDIEAAEQALEKSTNQVVIEFAKQMIEDHEAVNEQALALVTRLGVTPEDNPTSQTLSQQAADKLSELELLDGTAFDKAYIDNEVAYHASVNSALSTLLIPSAQDPELKSLLETGLTLFTEHQHHAEMVAAEIR
jgi:putative membrane protein